MTLQQLYYIVELSKHNSISAAAEALFIAQPSLSTTIKELEKEFHITILERNRHGITFTPEGLEFLNYANHIIEQTTNLREHFNPHQPSKNKLRLSISSQHYMFAVDAFTDYLQTLSKKPQYAITFREGRTSQVIQDVVTQRSQIGIIFISKMTQKFMTRTLRKNRLKFTELFAYPPSVFLQANHPLAKYPSLSIDQLRPYPYIQYTQEEDSYQFSEEVIIPDIKPEREISTTDRSTLFSVIADRCLHHRNGHLIPQRSKMAHRIDSDEKSVGYYARRLDQTTGDSLTLSRQSLYRTARKNLGSQSCHRRKSADQTSTGTNRPKHTHEIPVRIKAKKLFPMHRGRAFLCSRLSRYKSAAFSCEPST